MGTKPGTARVRAAVQRLFEGNRLAKDFQIQAYEEALAASGLAAGATTYPSAIDSEKNKSLTQGGIAA